MGTENDQGYFPRGSSMLRRVQQERLVGLFFGQRALAIGACYPLPYIGTTEHTRGRERPFNRLVSTGKRFESIFFGTRTEADRTLASVHKMHARVIGKTPEAAGRFPAGSPYSAYDPELMLWTVAVAADSSRYFYELFVRRLDEADRDALWRDWVRFGELFGMPREIAPSTDRDFRAWFSDKLASDDMYLSDEARETGYSTAFEIPMDAFAQPFKRVHDLVMRGSLPPRVRELYGLSWTPAHALASRPAIEALRAGRVVVPRQLTKGRNTTFFDSVARVERQRIARGGSTPHLPPREAAA